MPSIFSILNTIRKAMIPLSSVVSTPPPHLLQGSTLHQDCKNTIYKLSATDKNVTRHIFNKCMMKETYVKCISKKMNKNE